ncbi:folylpolyglutamate synthase, mitochondrial isoform X2 [Sceloporus undulatus]|uniref:folylpolyglutamate synthase, mitochondrial isoform X2 n=1 Tax=Sceloporus undulatus TaxID=8520 RepID=UPI001C4B0948|nr:folylpolyglutamate synthase, mitochondrial isoform X2 [Sceloporus undulatus]
MDGRHGVCCCSVAQNLTPRRAQHMYSMAANPCQEFQYSTYKAKKLVLFIEAGYSLTCTQPAAMVQPIFKFLFCMRHGRIPPSECQGWHCNAQHPLLPGHRRNCTQECGEEDAIRTLNTLQTNASYLEQVKRERGDPQAQLEAMTGFLERSGLKVRDLDQLNIIHVTGTKGKGSACAFTERVLRNYGLKTGFYSSPHLVQVRERIRINGQPISKELFSKYFWQVYNRLEETKDSSHVAMPAYFRFLTIMAFHVFLQEKVDLAVLEVGIGGAYDCTNIVRKPVVCGISALGIDHTSILGDTIEKIAWQKGGIFKCPLYLCPDLDAFEEEEKPLQLGLAGDHQRSNAALALQLSHTWLGQNGYLDITEPKGPCPDSELLAKRPPPVAPAFKLDKAMVQGLQETVWLGRNQVLHHGPVTWYIDGAHTTTSIQACVRWFHQAALNEKKTADGSEVRVLLFNATGDRDTAALLKLLLPCQFDYAVFCPNFTEVSTVGNADQQNFNVTLENVLTRCLQNQSHWNRLMEAKVGQDPWLSAASETEGVGGWLKQVPLHGPPLFAPPSARPLNTNSLVFPCVSHALQWITQGRDPHFQPPAPRGQHPHPVASSGAVLLKEAATVRVLVTGSLHLVGAVLKLLDQSLSQ